MTAAQLMAQLDKLGVQLEARGDRLRFSPRAAVTPVLVEQLKAHKPELLAALRDPTCSNIPPAAMIRTTTVTLTSDPFVTGQAGEVAAHIAFGTDGWPVGSTDLANVHPCPSCDSLELWTTATVQERCQKCDPPVAALRLLTDLPRLRTGTVRVAHDERTGWSMMEGPAQ